MRLIDNPLWKRALYGGGFGLFAAVVMVGFQLLVGDVQGGRAFHRPSPDGSISLWPLVAAVSVGLPLAGIVVGALLPLYRLRFGGVGVGVAVVAIFLLSALVVSESSRLANLGASTHSVILLIASLVCFGLIAQSFRESVLGEPPNEELKPTATRSSLVE